MKELLKYYKRGNTKFDKMDLTLNRNLKLKYKSNSQKIRVITEDWTAREIFCPNCGFSVKQYPANKPVADFYCDRCIEDFEQKSKLGRFGKKIPAGEYNKMIARILSKQKPNFFFMGYLKSMSIDNFFVVPKYLFIPEIIEKRKPLAKTARRAGWVGSNILFYNIPKDGQIYYIKNGIEIDKKIVLEAWQKIAFIKNIRKVESKGWILDIMNCLDELKSDEFSLEEIYKFEKKLKELHPENNNIRPKIRQQLQFLRNKGYLKFLGNGMYRKN